mmetsp:Transcript_28039/g.62537  ORF Transcript_28039/g.62537 Transcript_28039/m.62537 type:complete len:141 (+) Transcript_28039:277-699(+)
MNSQKKMSLIRSITQGLVKMFAKFAIVASFYSSLLYCKLNVILRWYFLHAWGMPLACARVFKIGAGVFVVANGAMRVALPKEVMDMEAELGKQAVGFLDFNQDGKIDMEDAKSIHQKALPFIKKHVPLSAGFLSGFTFSL